LHETAHGAVIDVLPQNQLIFEHGSVGRTITNPVRVRNVGNSAINLFPSVTGSMFALQNPGDMPTAPGDSSTVVLAYTPTDASPSMGTFSLSGSASATCSPLPTILF